MIRNEQDCARCARPADLVAPVVAVAEVVARALALPDVVLQVELLPVLLEHEQLVLLQRRLVQLVATAQLVVLMMVVVMMIKLLQMLVLHLLQSGRKSSRSRSTRHPSRQEFYLTHGRQAHWLAVYSPAQSSFCPGEGRLARRCTAHCARTSSRGSAPFIRAATRASLLSPHYLNS